MPKPNRLNATGDKNSGYSNILKINNTTYETNKDKYYLCLSKLLNYSLSLYELQKFIKSDFSKLKKYLCNNSK